METVAPDMAELRDIMQVPQGFASALTAVAGGKDLPDASLRNTLWRAFFGAHNQSTAGGVSRSRAAECKDYAAYTKALIDRAGLEGVETKILGGLFMYHGFAPGGHAVAIASVEGGATYALDSNMAAPVVLRAHPDDPPQLLRFQGQGGEEMGPVEGGTAVVQVVYDERGAWMPERFVAPQALGPIARDAWPEAMGVPMGDPAPLKSASPGAAPAI